MLKEREELCEKVIGLAAHILSNEGPDALTVRRIAQESGASTQLVYTLFGGKFGLMDGLYREGFHRMAMFLRERQHQTDARRNLENLLRGYREFCTQNRAFYTVMFTRPTSEYVPPQESLNEALESFSVFTEAILACQKLGELPGDPLYVARKLWSHVHGVIALEMIGHLWNKAGDQIYDDLLKGLWKS